MLDQALSIAAQKSQVAAGTRMMQKNERFDDRKEFRFSTHLWPTLKCL